ncbi:zinc finger protein, partial [Clarias magur]
VRVVLSPPAVLFPTCFVFTSARTSRDPTRMNSHNIKCESLEPTEISSTHQISSGASLMMNSDEVKCENVEPTKRSSNHQLSS